MMDHVEGNSGHAYRSISFEDVGVYVINSEYCNQYLELFPIVEKLLHYI